MENTLVRAHRVFMVYTPGIIYIQKHHVYIIHGEFLVCAYSKYVD